MRRICLFILVLLFSFSNAYAIPISPIIPSGTTLPATCRTGSLFIDTDADTDGALYQCVATNSWKIVGSGAGGGIDTSGTPTAYDIAQFTDVDTVEGRSWVEFIADLAIITNDDVDDTPVDAATTAPISSNWAYDHITDADQHPEYASESVVGTSLNSDDLVNTGGVLETVSTIPHTNIAETVTAAWAFPTWNLTALTAEPTEVVGEIYRADNNTWDPCGIEGDDDYFVICTAADTYVALFDIAGNFYFSTIQAAMKVDTKAAAYTLTAANMNSIYIMTAAGDVDIPADQCDTATGKWITIKSSAAHSNSVDFLDAADDFYLSNGTLVDGAANELVLAGAAGSQVTLVCLQANKWWVTGEIGTCTSQADD